MKTAEPAKSPRDELLRRATAARHLLIKNFLNLYEQKVADTTAVLSEHAVKRGYTAARASKPGLLVVWLKQAIDGGRPPPLWVGKAAADLLIENRFVPRTEEEWDALICSWLLAHGPFPGRSAAVSALPEYLRGERAKQRIETLIDDLVPTFKNRIAIVVDRNRVLGVLADRPKELEVVVADEAGNVLERLQATSDIDGLIIDDVLMPAPKA